MSLKTRDSQSYVVQGKVDPLSDSIGWGTAKTPVLATGIGTALAN
jgi:hypothetical protein